MLQIQVTIRRWNAIGWIWAGRLDHTLWQRHVGRSPRPTGMSQEGWLNMVE